MQNPNLSGNSSGPTLISSRQTLRDELYSTLSDVTLYRMVMSLPGLGRYCHMIHHSLYHRINFRDLSAAFRQELKDAKRS